MGLRPPDRRVWHSRFGADPGRAAQACRSRHCFPERPGPATACLTDFRGAPTARRRHRPGHLPRFQRHEHRACCPLAGRVNSVNPPAPSTNACGLDTVEIARVERLLKDANPGDVDPLFTPRELADAGEGPGRFASLAARFAAKEACCKLFPRELALGV